MVQMGVPADAVWNSEGSVGKLVRNVTGHALLCVIQRCLIQMGLPTGGKANKIL